MSTELVQLSDEERGALILREDTIQSGLKDFVRVGLALQDIRDRRLYRAEFDTFEEYCERRWDLRKTAAYQKMNSANLVREMSAIADIQNEGQARALLPVEANRRAAVFEEARSRAESEGRPVTALDIKKVANPGTEKSTVMFLDLERIGMRALAVVWAVRPDLLQDIAGSQAELAQKLGVSKQVFNTYIDQFRKEFPGFQSPVFRSEESREKMREATTKSHKRRKAGAVDDGAKLADDVGGVA